ncbi:MAG: LON peptidase substrate-binding domain-containing protein, partial [Reyranella sp.]|nr:LON peptidase substrate-binding domain-containing protein [Reyranella sp.]
MTAPDDMNIAKPGPAPSGQPAMQPLPADALIVLPTRNLVLFPEMVFPLAIGRPATVAAAQQAVREQRQILVVLQHDPEKAEIGPDDLHRTGTVANIVRYVTAPDGTHHVICQGVQRFRITEFVEGHPYLLARGLHVVEPAGPGTGAGPEIEARF